MLSPFSYRYLLGRISTGQREKKSLNCSIFKSLFVSLLAHRAIAGSRSEGCTLPRNHSCALAASVSIRLPPKATFRHVLHAPRTSRARKLPHITMPSRLKNIRFRAVMRTQFTSTSCPTKNARLFSSKVCSCAEAIRQAPAPHAGSHTVNARFGGGGVCDIRAMSLQTAAGVKNCPT